MNRYSRAAARRARNKPKATEYTLPTKTMLWTSSETFFARCDLVVQEFARRGYRVYNKADTRVVGYYSGFTPIKVPAVTFYFVREDLMA